MIVKKKNIFYSLLNDQTMNSTLIGKLKKKLKNLISVFFFIALGEVKSIFYSVSKLVSYI